MPVTRATLAETRQDGSPATRPFVAGLACLLLAFGFGCDSKRHCSSNPECGSGYVCQQSQCISVVSGRQLAVEILPPSDSLLAQTEYPSLTFQGIKVDLQLDATVLVSGVVEPAASPTMYSPDAHVQVTIPSRLPGRPGQQVTTEMAMNQFTFGVGSSRIGTATASFLFTPGTINSQSQPPLPFALDKLDSTLDFTFPTNDEMTVIHGQLVDDQNNPLAGYLAKALYQGPQGQQVSNTFPTLSDGTFALLIPPMAVPSMNDAITLTLTPPAKMVPSDSNTQTASTIIDLPQFVSTPVSMKQLAQQTTIPVFILPAFVPATPQVFTVLSDDGQPQSGVAIRFTMNVPLSAGGNAYFQASATSDSGGIVTVPLVPGTAAQPVSYQVMIQGRDATFMYASQCIPALSLNLDAAGNPPAPATFTLAPKVQLSGSVSDSMSAPAVNALVSATQISGVTDCGANATPPPVVSSKTGPGGEYYLKLDPGMYRIEVDPPPSSMVTYPRTVLDGAAAVTVSGALVHNISLPAGNVAMGTVYGPDGLPVPMASVEIFETFCKEAPCGAVQPPVSLAQVTTDATGSYQTVLPALP